MSRKTVTCFKRITAVLSSVFLTSAACAGAGLIANASATSITRISGNTRYETMEMVSQTAFPSTTSRVAVVASGSSFPDALAASSLAGHLNAPILLTDPKTLSNATINELNRLDANTIYIIGGKMRFQATLKMKSEHLVRQQLLHDSQGALASIPHIKSITNSPSSE